MPINTCQVSNRRCGWCPEDGLSVKHVLKTGLFGSNPPGRSRLRLFLICFALSIQTHGSKGHLIFLPFPRYVQRGTRQTPRGSTFDYGLSLLLLSMVTGGLIPGCKDVTKQISKRTLIFCCNCMLHSYTKVLLDFNCSGIECLISSQT